MRIFFPNGAIRYPPKQGREVHIYQLVRNLTLRGHEVVTLGDDEHPNSLTYPKTRRHVAAQLRSADVIYCRVEEAPNPATQLAMLPFRLVIPRSTPVVWEFNTSISKPMRGYHLRGPEEIESDLATLRKSVRIASAAVCVAPDLASQVNTLLAFPNTRVIQNASDPEMFRPDLSLPEEWRTSPDVMRVVFIPSGRQSHHSFDLVHEVAIELDRLQVPISVHIFGEAAVQSGDGIPRSLHAHGPASYLDLPNYLAGSDVGLALYGEPADFISPLKVFDYLSSECVPICSESSSIRAVLHGTDAGLIGDWSVNNLADTLVGLLEDPARLAAMKRAGRRLVTEEYNWARVAEKTEAVFEESIAQARGTGASAGATDDESSQTEGSA